MASPNTYVITSITSLGDVATVTGTVNGVAVTITCWLSALNQQPNASSVRNFLAKLMLNAAIPPVQAVVTSPTLIMAIGTFTQ